MTLESPLDAPIETLRPEPDSPARAAGRFDILLTA